MKEGIQPKYYQATVTCHCGNTFTTGSTKQNLSGDTGSTCQPISTGK